MAGQEAPAPIKKRWVTAAGRLQPSNGKMGILLQSSSRCASATSEAASRPTCCPGVFDPFFTTKRVKDAQYDADYDCRRRR